MSVEADWFLRAHPDISTIEALLPDCNGIMRGKWLPRHNLAKVYEGEFKIPLGTMHLDIWGRDVDELMLETGDADGICRPIEGSLLPTPWTIDGSLGQVMLSLYNLDGSPYMGDPRHVLQRVLKRFHSAGWRPVVAAELEFSLVHYDRENSQSVPRPACNSPIGGDMYGVESLQSNAALIQDIRKACEKQQLPFDGLVKESAPSQYEINMQHIDNPVLAADQIQMFKRLIKGVAAKHGLLASFMAKPFENESGNGMHVHCSVLDEHGNNIFDDGSDLGSDTLRHAIGGCLQYMAESTAIFAPNFNSYRRFQSGSLAPTAPSWGYDNRTVSVRVPAGKHASRRLEHRLAGTDSNPYLVLAVLLAAMIDGIEQRIDPGLPLQGDGYEQTTPSLPQYLPDAIEKFASSEFIKRNLGAELQRYFSLSKWQENNEFRNRISPLEYQSYLERL